MGMRLMKVSARGFNGIKEFEGFEPGAYPDLASQLGQALKAKGLLMRQYRQLAGWEKLDGKPWSIGYGWTGLVFGKPIVPGMIINQQQASDLLAERLPWYEDGVSQMLKVKVTQGQFDALVSFAWNFGVNRLKQSRLMLYVNAGAFGAAAGQFPLWVKSAGVTEPGLVRRRKMEQGWFVGEDA